MSAQMFFNDGPKFEVESDGGEITLWIRSRNQTVGVALPDEDRAALIASLQAPKEIEA